MKKIQKKNIFVFLVSLFLESVAFPVFSPEDAARVTTKSMQMILEAFANANNRTIDKAIPAGSVRDDFLKELRKKGFFDSDLGSNLEKTFAALFVCVVIGNPCSRQIIGYFNFDDFDRVIIDSMREIVIKHRDVITSVLNPYSDRFAGDRADFLREKLDVVPTSGTNPVFKIVQSPVSRTAPSALPTPASTPGVSPAVSVTS